MQEFEWTNNAFAQVAGGLEELAAEELRTLGATRVRAEYHGVYFEADSETLYRCNYASRFCSRILRPISRMDCHSTQYLQQRALELPWSDLFSVEQTFAISAHVSNCAVNHSRYAALCLKDAIADHFRDKFGERPNVDAREPDVAIDLFWHGNNAVISIDTTGRALHRRGYRQESVEAPIQETLGAAIIAWSGWDGERPLHDPFCGSGTLLAEALMHYCRIPAGYLNNDFAFMRLPDFKPRVWKEVKAACDADMRELPEGLISGSDRDRTAISAARENLTMLPGGENVQLECLSFQDLEELENRCIVCNPPFGIRLENSGNIEEIVGELGDFLKQRCTGSDAFIYFGERSLLKKIGLRARFKKPMVSGGLDGRVAQFELYRASRKPGKQG